jgi:hypothetical protein
VNSKQLRRSLKVKWLTYYRDNREWIDNLGIWVTSDGQRRPSSGFILGALSTLEPDLNSLLPLVVELSSNPDRIIAALGLNISPAQELKALEKAQRMLPSSEQPKATLASVQHPVLEQVNPARYDDESCTGARNQTDDRPRP